jgi:addiction module RelE/StbE family toxin
VKVLWSRQALNDRTGIFRHISADNPRAAATLDGKFAAAAKRLSAHPQIGRPGRLSGTRELVVVPNYILVYRLAGETIGIVTVLHAARQWPPEGNGTTE